MSGRTPREAAGALVSPRQDVLRCLTDIGFVSRRSRAGRFYSMSLQTNPAPLRRQRGLPPIYVRVFIDYTLQEAVDRRGWWDAHIIGWVYDVLDAEGRSIVSFHWHPSSGRVTWPHLHAYGTNDSMELHKLHPPTGPVTVSSVVRFLIEDLDVQPRRSDWQAILERHAAV